MEEKYSKFLNYSWKDSREWSSYYNNIFPPPPGNKIERYKRKFYKLKIDSDFDIDYKVESSTTASASTSSTNNNSNNQQKKEQREKETNNNIKTNNNALFPITIIESLLMVFFMLSLPFNYHTLQWVVISYIIRTIRLCGIPMFSMSYFKLMLSNEAFYVLVYSIILMIDRFNYFLIIPIALRLIVDFCGNLSTSALAPYSNIILSKKNEIIASQTDIEIANGFIMIIGIYVKLNSFIVPMIYWQLIKVKYTFNQDTKNSWSKLNKYVDTVKLNPNQPQILVSLLDKIQSFFSYLGTIDIGNESKQ